MQIKTLCTHLGMPLDISLQLLMRVHPAASSRSAPPLDHKDFLARIFDFNCTNAALPTAHLLVKRRWIVDSLTRAL